jgi:heterodisulfide reductase subunit A-like polyferredoxin
LVIADGLNAAPLELGNEVLAESGFKVYLVEKSAAIGGRMAQLDRVFPTDDCGI